MQKYGFCFQLSFKYDWWAFSNAEVWLLFPAIFWVWLLSFFKCRSMVFCFQLSFGYNSWSSSNAESKVSVSSYLFCMVVELVQMWKYGFCFQLTFGYGCWASSNAEVWFLFPAIFRVWFLSSTSQNYDFCFQLWFWYDYWAPDLDIWIFFPPATLWGTILELQICMWFFCSVIQGNMDREASQSRTGSWICRESIHVFQYMQKNREVRCNGNHDMHKQLHWYWQFFWHNRNHDMHKCLIFTFCLMQ